MSKTSFTFNLISTAYVLQVTMNIEALNIHIKNSYQVNNSEEMKQIIDMIMNKSCYKQLAAAGYTRTKESLLREWKAHSVLYRLGYKKEQTGSADLNQNESRGRRIAYFFLSWFY